MYFALPLPCICVAVTEKKRIFVVKIVAWVFTAVDNFMYSNAIEATCYIFKALY